MILTISLSLLVAIMMVLILALRLICNIVKSYPGGEAEIEAANSPPEPHPSPPPYNDNYDKLTLA